MRARSLQAEPFEGARFAVSRSLVGIGEPLSRPPRNLEAAIDATSRQHGEKSGRMLHRFAGLPPGTFVWTRTSANSFRLGRIKGPWKYDYSDEALATGICQVRTALWLPGEFGRETVPRAVSHSFKRGGRNLQRIGETAIDAESSDLWATFCV